MTCISEKEKNVYETNTFIYEVIVGLCSFAVGIYNFEQDYFLSICFLFGSFIAIVSASIGLYRNPKNKLYFKVLEGLFLIWYGFGDVFSYYFDPAIKGIELYIVLFTCFCFAVAGFLQIIQTRKKWKYNKSLNLDTLKRAG